MKKAGRIKNKLADMLLDLFGEGYSIDPNDLRTNKGAQSKNDIASWHGYLTNPYGYREGVYSYDNMTFLTKCKSLSFVGGKKEILPEITGIKV